MLREARQKGHLPRDGLLDWQTCRRRTVVVYPLPSPERAAHHAQPCGSGCGS